MYALEFTNHYKTFKENDLTILFFSHGHSWVDERCTRVLLFITEFLFLYLSFNN